MIARGYSRFLLGAIMALAIVSYLTIAANAPRSVGGGMYELAASGLDYADLLPGAQGRPGDSTRPTVHRAPGAGNQRNGI